MCGRCRRPQVEQEEAYAAEEAKKLRSKWCIGGSDEAGNGASGAERAERRGSSER
jgi:hypothetical protein